MAVKSLAAYPVSLRPPAPGSCLRVFSLRFAVVSSHGAQEQPVGGSGMAGAPSTATVCAVAPRDRHTELGTDGLGGCSLQPSSWCLYGQ